MEPFATAEQHEARFGEVDDKSMLGQCLEDATAAIRAEFARRHVDISERLKDELFADACMRVCRSVANRIMPSGVDVPLGASSVAETDGPYSRTVSYAPSYGLPKLLPSELSMLGLGGGRAGWGRM
ncbi:MAG: Gp19/Gp15/Gp42 family protein [Adlercreutzia equolifaciens]